MSATQRDALDRLWDSHGVTVDGSPLDLAALFGPGVPVVLEIGSGMGETTAALAAASPGTGFLAVDVHTPGLGALLHRVERDGLANVRVALGDACDLLADMLPEASLREVLILFPDPWPKARHHKRRLLQPAFAALVASRLEPGGRLRCATDWAPYAAQMLHVLAAEPLLANCHPDVAPRPADRPVTRFERGGLARGHTIVDLEFVRRQP